MNSFVAKFTMFWILKKGLQKYGIPKYEITKLKSCIPRLPDSRISKFSSMKNLKYEVSVVNMTSFFFNLAQ